MLPTVIKIVKIPPKRFFFVFISNKEKEIT